jgi:hypothetical protein
VKGFPRRFHRIDSPRCSSLWPFGPAALLPRTHPQRPSLSPQSRPSLASFIPIRSSQQDPDRAWVVASKPLNSKALEAEILQEGVNIRCLHQTHFGGSTDETVRPHAEPWTPASYNDPSPRSRSGGDLTKPPARGRSSSQSRRDATCFASFELQISGASVVPLPIQDRVLGKPPHPRQNHLQRRGRGTC